MGIRSPVRWDQDLSEIREMWTRQAQDGVSLVIGTSNERAAAQSLGVPFVEMGYPSLITHALYDSPWMGFNGVLWLANRLHNLLAEYRYNEDTK